MAQSSRRPSLGKGLLLLSFILALAWIADLPSCGWESYDYVSPPWSMQLESSREWGRLVRLARVMRQTPPPECYDRFTSLQPMNPLTSAASSWLFQRAHTQGWGGGSVWDSSIQPCYWINQDLGLIGHVGPDCRPDILAGAAGGDDKVVSYRTSLHVAEVWREKDRPVVHVRFSAPIDPATLGEDWLRSAQPQEATPVRQWCVEGHPDTVAVEFGSWILGGRVLTVELSSPGAPVGLAHEALIDGPWATVHQVAIR